MAKSKRQDKGKSDLKMSLLVKNIKTVLSLASDEEYTKGYTWYEDAYNWSLSVAERHKTSVYCVAAILSALSPSAKWERNKGDTLTVLSAVENGLTPDKYKVTTYGFNKVKAHMIALECGVLNREAYEHFLSYFVNGTKTQNFYKNIAQRDTENALTIDGHAIHIATLGYRRVGITALDKGAFNKYDLLKIKEAYKTVAKQEGLGPHQL